MAESTGQEVKRLRRQSDNSQKRKEKENKDSIEGDKGGTQTEHTPRRCNRTSPPYKRISLKRLQSVENSLAFGMEMLPVLNKTLPSSSSVQASLPSHSAPSSYSFSGSHAYKSEDQRDGLNLNFLPPVDEGLLILLQDADSFCITKAYAEAVSALCTALQVQA